MFSVNRRHHEMDGRYPTADNAHLAVMDTVTARPKRRRPQWLPRRPGLDRHGETVWREVRNFAAEPASSKRCANALTVELTAAAARRAKCCVRESSIAECL
jgi:hypothetical protein